MTHCTLSTRRALLSVLLMLPMAGGAQTTPFRNLQVLPPDISEDSLFSIMGGFTRALGVRCNHCHVARNGGRPTAEEFASDDREPKRVARVMLRMVADINQRHLPTTGRSLVPAHAVTCGSCHRGVVRPFTLDVELMDRYRVNGLDSTIALYRRLRGTFFGRATYDFGEVTLPTLGDRIAQDSSSRADALVLMRLNLEFHPQSWFTLQQMGQLQVAMGDTAGAIASYDRALSLNPGREFLKELRAKLPPAPAPREPPARKF